MFPVHNLLIINLKNYLEIGGKESLKLVETATQVSEKYNVNIIVAPPQCSVMALAQLNTIPIICQHLDDSVIGATTGFVIPEIAKSCGAKGSLINHSEHKIDPQTTKNLIQRLCELRMTSVVCASNLKEVEVLSKLSPNFIAIEPPELIGKGIAVSKVNPSLISNAVKTVKANSDRTEVLCGAGIVDKTDVERALELGVIGILVASGVVKARSWVEKIRDLASAFK